VNSVCLAVLNYNGRRHLDELLPTALSACQESPLPASVLVLDNCPGSGDAVWLRAAFPEVRTVVAPENRFLHSYNWLLPQLPDDVVVLLNNDLRLKQGFIGPLLRHFRQADVFSVSASSYDWEGTGITSGPARLVYQSGLYSWGFDRDRQELSHTLFTSGGFMAVDRRKFLALGGFNPLLYPAYCEDLDLCFRAWRKGWRCIYEPASVVNHREHASWSLNGAGRPHRLNLRSALLFQWSTLPMGKDRCQRAGQVLNSMLRGLLRGDALWLRVWPRALIHWLKVRHRHSHLKVTEGELRGILRRIASPRVCAERLS
jgi:GT2 family glycosyltransferase